MSQFVNMFIIRIFIRIYMFHCVNQTLLCSFIHFHILYNVAFIIFISFFLSKWVRGYRRNIQYFSHFSPPFSSFRKSVYSHVKTLSGNQNHFMPSIVKLDDHRYSFYYYYYEMVSDRSRIMFGFGRWDIA